MSNANDKAFYRSEFVRLKEFIKLSACAKKLDIPQTNVSWFMKGRDERLSIEKLKQLYDFIYNEIL